MGNGSLGVPGLGSLWSPLPLKFARISHQITTGVGGRGSRESQGRWGLNLDKLAHTQQVFAQKNTVKSSCKYNGKSAHFRHESCVLGSVLSLPSSSPWQGGRRRKVRQAIPPPVPPSLLYTLWNSPSYANFTQVLAKGDCGDAEAWAPHSPSQRHLGSFLFQGTSNAPPHHSPFFFLCFLFLSGEWGAKQGWTKGAEVTTKRIPPPHSFKLLATWHSLWDLVGTGRKLRGRRSRVGDIYRTPFPFSPCFHLRCPQMVAMLEASMGQLLPWQAP